MKLKYKTLGDCSPQGLPRVYFTCHEDDFDIYFKSICSEIWTKQNCAIFYVDRKAQDYDQVECFELLKDIQLFVMPVTTNLLVKPNEAIDVDFAFAIKQNIPILPLIQEAGLDELFYQKCGDLQYLDKCNNDLTAIPYDKKLSKMLSAILIGDELAKEIKEEFEATIFLSYRKKDRKYAQQLMRAIHNNDFCRDIAIWYDEFLVPGEKFNNAIKDAISKSNLFAILVTPNLINEENYVKTIEFPLAKNLKKSMFPAEMIKTDKTILAKQFTDIPECINAMDDKCLTTSLQNVVNNMEKKEKEKNSKHNYLIGLAYLNGINVEVDKKRALTLIENSANEGLLEAMKKISQMYQDGEGVERNYEKSIEWQEKVVDECRKIFKKDNTNDSAIIYHIEMEELGDRCASLWWYNKAKIFYNQAVDFCKQILDKYSINNTISIDIEDWNRMLVVNYTKLGNIEANQWNFDLAEDYYKKSLTILEGLLDNALINKKMWPETIREVPICYSNLGDMAMKKGNFDYAKHCYQKSLKMFESLAVTENTVELISDLSLIYERLGGVAIAQGDLELAKEYCNKSLEKSKLLVEETRTIKSRGSLAVIYDRLSDIAQQQKDLELAKEYCQKCFDIIEQLAEETKTVKSRTDLSVVYVNFGDIALQQGDLTLAKEYYQKSLDIIKQLSKDIYTIEIRNGFAVSYDKLGFISVKQGNLELAREYYKKEINIREQLVEETKAVDALCDLSDNYAVLGDIEEQQGELEIAVEYYKKEVIIREQLVEKVRTSETITNLFQCCNDLGSLAKIQGDLKLAKECFFKSLIISSQIDEKPLPVEIIRNFCICCINLGDIEVEVGNLEKAKEYYQKGLDTGEYLVGERNTVQSYDDLAVCYYKFGLFNNDEIMMIKAYNIWRRLNEKYPRDENFRQKMEEAKQSIDDLIGNN